MKWNEISVGTNGIWADAVSDMLMEYGAGGVEIVDDEQIRKNLIGTSADGLPDIRFFDASLTGITVRGYFPEGNYGSNESFNVSAALIRDEMSSKVHICSFDIRTVDDEDWANEWKRYFKPFHITGNVVIKPSWETYIPNECETVVEIDPGMAFGTGTHETTTMCAALIEKHLATGMCFLDVGCGSGILSVIALLLGASHAVAIDIDRTAVRVSAENAHRNKVADRFDVCCSKLEDIGIPIFAVPSGYTGYPTDGTGLADMAAANITADAINALIPFIPRYVCGRRLYIVSGIIKDRKAEVFGNHVAAGYELVDEKEMNEWVAMVFRCPGSM